MLFGIKFAIESVTFRQVIRFIIIKPKYKQNEQQHTT